MRSINSSEHALEYFSSPQSLIHLMARCGPPRLLVVATRSRIGGVLRLHSAASPPLTRAARAGKVRYERPRGWPSELGAVATGGNHRVVSGKVDLARVPELVPSKLK